MYTCKPTLSICVLVMNAVFVVVVFVVLFVADKCAVAALVVMVVAAVVVVVVVVTPFRLAVAGRAGGNVQDVCEAGGKNFQAIFGARTPLIESFLIKRKLMGPCWVTVRNPKVKKNADLMLLLVLTVVLIQYIGIYRPF